MSEADVIKNSYKAATVASLAMDLRRLGVKAGMNLLVHSSLSKLGWVVGGAHAVVLALQETVTEKGTLVMPAYSSDNSDPSHWNDPPVPEPWHQVIRDHMPAFDKEATPSRRLGAIPELFRTLPGVFRSDHPGTSFAAWGLHGKKVTDDHRLDSSFGEFSPLARVYDLDGHILFLGTGHDSNSSLHLAEHRADWPSKSNLRAGAAMTVDGQRNWVTYENLRYSDKDFLQLGNEFSNTIDQVTGLVARAKAQLIPQRSIVDFGSKWISRHR